MKNSQYKNLNFS